MGHIHLNMLIKNAQNSPIVGSYKSGDTNLHLNNNVNGHNKQ